MLFDMPVHDARNAIVPVPPATSQVVALTPLPIDEFMDFGVAWRPDEAMSLTGSSQVAEFMSDSDDDWGPITARASTPVHNDRDMNQVESHSLAPVFEVEDQDTEQVTPHASTPVSDAEVDEASSEESEIADDPAPVVSGGRFRDPPRNRGKKSRQPNESMLLRAWVPDAGKGKWMPVNMVDEDLGAELKRVFRSMVMRPPQRKSLWARFQDPINIKDHYSQCIGRALIRKDGFHVASHHRACEYCLKRRQLCALIHEAPVDFIGILPLPSSLRQGRSPDDIRFWLSR
jgi:hypothetical protein